jgi:hypothetical protein
MHHSREDLLEQFAMEPEHDRETLERYLRRYPHLAGDLIDLSSEISCNYAPERTDLSKEDKDRIDRAWVLHVGKM